MNERGPNTQSIDIYSLGLVYCSVCAAPEMGAEEVERAVNAKEPTGVGSDWTVADESFRTGEANPHLRECGQGERRHWLLSC